MKIYLYNCNDSNNTINKTLLNKEEKNILLKSNVDISHPIIRIKTNDVINKNYCYIPDFGRYYFIHDITVINNNIQELKLVCDVLESFKDDILNSNSIIRVSEQESFISNGLISEEKRIADMYEGEKINYKDNIILVGIK